MVVFDNTPCKPFLGAYVPALATGLAARVNVVIKMKALAGKSTSINNVRNLPSYTSNMFVTA